MLGAELPPPVHGALEYGIPGPGGTPAAAPGIWVAFAQGAAVPGPLPLGEGLTVVGWFAKCTVCAGTAASGSGSHENSDPN